MKHFKITLFKNRSAYLLKNDSQSRENIKPIQLVAVSANKASSMYPYEVFFHSDNYSHTYHVLLNSPIFFPDHSMHLKET